MTIGSHSFQVTAADWNTIFSKSIVPQTVTLAMDASFDATPTTTARFQYLADAIGRYMPAHFTMFGLLRGVTADGNIISVVVILNPSADAYRLSKVTQTITQGASADVVTKGSFYTATGKFILLPPHSVYFGRWSSPQRVKLADNQRSTWHFHWDALEDCHGTTCD